MAKTIMIQGTMSNAGKSLICTGLCRIFRQDGYKVAPFKSQNMALNSFITEEGLEMGRAQVVQAEAAGIAPQVQMNPILLKPTNDMGSQVIVNGEVQKNMSAREYFAYKKQLIPDIRKAFRQLDEMYDIIVIEGAGSPAEINLKEDDIVNMGMAKMAKAPVLLVGDIDRGGVFAQLLGTLMLLDEDEKEMVKGLLINKFRGDKTILDPGIDMLTERGGIPVVGVAPYLDVEIEDEDSLTERFHGQKECACIDIAVIRTPRISNFTDFMLLENLNGVSLRYVDRPSKLGSPDMIILPGTKNTMEDLRWMRQNGLEARVVRAASHGTVIWGICGGYQMLGDILSDPEGIEAGGTMKGMGLLPLETIFTKEKTRTRVDGRFLKVEGILAGLEGISFEGYEIHMGETRSSLPAMSEIKDCAGKQTASQRTRQSMDGVSMGNVYGTYIHGIFDREDVVTAVVRALAARKGMILDDLKAVDLKDFKERQYDLLADGLRSHLDMKKIYEILEGGI
ncbi:Cobyric acid synthase [[Clostridium] scindens]|uniref:cobyric acid synthase n=1 Tax=Clostridium scindens (strain JCM 10418 / VPI 12708) TaxID=29347 RepID=UPI00298BDD66|nr:cobyric acid synthase [[Clostridium] scindens]WPB48920.1 Cobyric acid synthase [[Clostridium] scindens]